MGWIGKIVAMLFGWYLNRNKANITEIADSNARAQERLQETHDALEVSDKAAAAARDADARILRESDSKGGIDADGEGHWRD